MAYREHQEKKKFIIPETVIPQSEFNRRKAIYDEYYVKVRSTKAYQRYCDLRDAYKQKNLLRFGEILREVQNEMQNPTREIPMPNFPDPEDEMRAGRLGVEEVIEAEARKAKLVGTQVEYGNSNFRLTEDVAEEIFA